MKTTAPVFSSHNILIASEGKGGGDPLREKIENNLPTNGEGKGRGILRGFARTEIKMLGTSPFRP